MTEWGVVTVISALIVLFITLGKPILTLNKTITELSCSINNLLQQLQDLDAGNKKSHDHLWDKMNDNIEKIHNHELRIVAIETGVK